MSANYCLKANKLICVLILIIFIISAMDAEARRRYNPKLTKQQAIEIIRTNSETVSELAGLEPLAIDNDTMNIILNSDSEIEELTCAANMEDLNEDSEIGERGENIEELEMEDDVTVDMETFRTLWLSYAEEGEDFQVTQSGIQKTDIMDEIMDWLGTPYRFGGTSERAIDCSAFIREIFKSTSEIMLPRTAREQYRVGEKIEMEELEFGDMIFFHTYTRRFPSHVGIYLGDSLFAHASSRYGVTVSSLKSTYYNKRFIGGKRLCVDDLVKYSIIPFDDRAGIQ